MTSAPEGLVRPEVSSTAALPSLPLAAALRPSDSRASVPWCLPPAALGGLPSREEEVLEPQQGGRWFPHRVWRAPK